MTGAHNGLSRFIRNTLVLGGLGLVGTSFWRQQQQSGRVVPYASLPHARVVVLGAGFAGLAAATELAKASRAVGSPEIVVVDRHNYHLFTPLLYQVATGNVEPGHLTYPARVIALERGFEFRESIVQGVNLAERRVMLDDGELSYDYLVVALGSIPNFFNMADVAEHALPLKTVADALVIHNRVIDRFEEAAIEPDPERRRQLLTFIIAGGGATGVELAASLKDLIHKSLLPQYPMIHASAVRLILVEANERLLNGWDSRMSDLAALRLREAGVELWTNTAVARVWDGGIETRDGRRIDAATLIWTAGVQPNPVANTLVVERGRDKRIVVDPDMRVKGHERLFAAGDIAAVTPPGAQRPLPPTAPVAIAHGRAVGRNILRLMAGEPTEPIHFVDKGDLISLGRWTAAAELFGFVFDGFPAWVTRRTIYLLNLISFKNRFAVAMDWAFSLAGRQNTARVDIERAAVALLTKGGEEKPRRTERAAEQPTPQKTERRRRAG